MKINGTNIILLNDKNAVLLQLRDDKPTIPYPNMWALPGGHIDEGETPQECITREVKEELGIELKEISLFVAAERSYGTEHSYWARAYFDLEEVKLSEGQGVQWFSYEEIQKMQLIYEDNLILEDFFKKRPYDPPASKEIGTMFEEEARTTILQKRSVNDVPLEPTRHGALKKVLLRHEEVHSHLMFLNEVYVAPGEIISAHRHEDMEEIFYFLDGKGTMQIEDEVHPVVAGDRVIIPIQKIHILENTGEEQMRFICFGVKVTA